jgi:hypothetical protein
MDPRVVLPRLLAALEQLSPAAHQQLTVPGCGLSAIPAYAMEDELSDWWDGEEASAVLNALVGALNEAAPEGFFFGIEGDCRQGFYRLYEPAPSEIEATGLERRLEQLATKHASEGREESPRMMPGQAPYTPSERAGVGDLLAGAAQAEDLIDADELEEHARVARKREMESKP